MKITSLGLPGIAFLALTCVEAMAQSSAKILYANAGDNTEGFALEYGDASFSVDNHTLLGASGGGWFSLPIVLKGNFQLDFDVYGDSNDVDSDIMFVDEKTGAGIEINDCPQDTDTPTISIKSGANLCDHDGFYYNLTTLLSATSKKFPNRTWTHVRISRKGNVLTNNVGGQVIATSLDDGIFPAVARLGFGYYSTQNLGGNGLIRYANIRVVQPSCDEATPPATIQTPAVKSTPDDRD